MVCDWPVLNLKQKIMSSSGNKMEFDDPRIDENHSALVVSPGYENISKVP